MNPILTNWCRTCEPNFGDMLTSVLLTHYDIPHEWADPKHARLFMVGSIISKVPFDSTATILGTGLISPDNAKLFDRPNVLAVRGALTRDMCGIGDVVLGEAGILVGDWAGTQRHTEAGCLWVPHQADRRHPLDLLPYVQYADTLSPRQLRPDAFYDQLSIYATVYSSSLHALIAADVLGIPHAYVPCDRVTGGDFKFQDYASAFGDEFVPYKLRLTDRVDMNTKQDEMRALVLSLKEAP